MYRVQVIVKTIETYEVQAENEDEAADLWCEGKLVRTDDNLQCEIMEVKEV